MNLQSLGSRVVKSGFTVEFPTTVIHKILAAKPNTLTLNFVSQSESSTTHFDTFVGEQCKNPNVRLEKDYLSAEESRVKISEIISILDKY